MYMCAQCSIRACKKGEREHWPTNCPMREMQLMQSAYEEYQKEDNHRFYVTSSELEALGYGMWPRVRETMELCRRMNFHKIGLAFCGGLHPRTHGGHWPSALKRIDRICTRGGCAGPSSGRLFHRGACAGGGNGPSACSALCAAHTLRNSAMQPQAVKTSQSVSRAVEGRCAQGGPDTFYPRGEGERAQGAFGGSARLDQR